MGEITIAQVQGVMKVANQPLERRDSLYAINGNIDCIMQSIAQFDRTMAIGVRKTFKKEFKMALEELLEYNDCHHEFQQEIIDFVFKHDVPTYKNKVNLLTLSQEVEKRFGYKLKKINIKHMFTKIYQTACKRTEKETAQAMEAVIHNFNTLHSRSGAQVPFSSLNFGTDTTEEGRLVTEKLLLAQEAGLGNGETSIFPITIFRLKEGINYNPEDKNYDLFKLACRVSAKRLYPNFESQDATFNLKYYDPNDYRTEIATMGCRTRTVSNVNGPNIVTSRGNFSFTTINLPKIAIESNREVKKFFKSLDKTMKLCKEQLLWRLDLVGKRHAYNFPFLMGQHLWLDSEKLKPTDEIREVLKHASISIGFCGLAEALVSLIGHHHGENEEAQKLGLKIIGHMREVCDKFADETHLNFTLFGSPAESTAGSFQRSNRKQYGVIKGVTDREYMTNSSHVPVYYPISAFEKIKIEAPYHELQNAGHISYVEIDGDPVKNLEAFEKVIRCMHDSNMGYFSINHPVDRCPSCGQTGIIDGDVCPFCGYSEKIEEESVVVKISDVEK